MADLHSREGGEGITAGGLEALRCGDRGRARELLGRAVRENSGDERAWIGLAATFAELDRQRYCLERALTINPANQGTRRALAGLAAGGQAEDSLAWVEAALASGDVRPETAHGVPAPAASPPAAVAPQQATPAAGMTLAARLAAAEAKRSAQPDSLAEPPPEAPPVEDLRRTRVARARRISEPPVQLLPVLLSDSPREVGERLSQEDVAEAAVQRLLRQGQQPSAAAPAASIAERYFGPARSRQQDDTAAQASRALDAGGAGRRVGRPAVLIGALLVIGFIGVLLFAVLVGLNGAAA